MRDQLVSLPRINLLHPKVRIEVMSLIENIESGFPETVVVRVVQGLRTEQEQNDIYSLGRTKKNDTGVSALHPMGAIVTNAKFGQSFHCFGLAFDFALIYGGKLSWDVNTDFDKDGTKDWQEVVLPFKKLGWTWGGDFKSIQDEPHLEKTFGYGWRDLLAKYNKKDFIAGTNYVNL